MSTLTLSMKKISFVLVLLMIIPVLSGCLGDDDSSDATEIDIEKLLIDTDKDGVIDSIDNCPEYHNPVQLEDDLCGAENFSTPGNPSISTRSSGVTSFTVIPSKYVYSLTEDIEAQFIGNWFEPQQHLYISIHLRDINGIMIYQDVIGMIGQTSLDTLYPNDPALGGHIWEEDSPHHPSVPTISNNYDFSAAAIGAGEFCWDASITAQEHSSPGVVFYEESDQVTECFLIQSGLDTYNPDDSIPDDSITTCSGDQYLVTDIYASNTTNTEVRLKAPGFSQDPSASASSFFTDPWEPTVEVNAVDQSLSWNPVTPDNSDWIWMNYTSCYPACDYQWLDFKMTIEIPADASEVVANFDGLVDNKFFRMYHHPDLSMVSDPPVAIIAESSTQQLTQWAMPKMNLNPYEYFQQGQQYSHWLPASGPSPTSYDLYLGAKQDTSAFGLAFSVEVTYCIGNTSVGEDNDPPQVVADIFATDEVMQSYDWDSGVSASVDYIGLLSWDSWDYDGQIVDVYVDHNRDGVGDILLDGEEGSMFVMNIPFLNGIQTNRYQMSNGDCMLLFHRMIDVIATDNSGMTMTYTIRTGVDGVWGTDNDDLRSTTRKDAEWFTNTLQFSSQDDLDWIMGVGNSPCAAPPQFSFTEDASLLQDASIIGVLTVDSVGSQTYGHANLGATISAYDPITGTRINNLACAVELVYSDLSSTNIVAGEYYTISESSTDTTVCDIANSDVSNYDWRLSINFGGFDMPTTYHWIT